MTKIALGPIQNGKGESPPNFCHVQYKGIVLATSSENGQISEGSL